MSEQSLDDISKNSYLAIKEMIDDLIAAEDNDDDDAREQAIDIIMNDPLSIEIRSDWYVPGDEPEPNEYNILLCTGGPAVRIIGKLSQYMEPETAILQSQDWFKPWTNWTDQGEEETEILLKYAQNFYFG